MVIWNSTREQCSSRLACSTGTLGVCRLAGARASTKVATADSLDSRAGRGRVPWVAGARAEHARNGTQHGVPVSSKRKRKKAVGTRSACCVAAGRRRVRHATTSTTFAESLSTYQHSILMDEFRIDDQAPQGTATGFFHTSQTSTLSRLCSEFAGRRPPRDREHSGVRTVQASGVRA